MTVPTPHVACPIAPTPLATCHAATSDVSCPHIASHPERTNGLSNSSLMPLPLHPTATCLRFHGVSCEPHPRIAPCSMRSRASFTLSPTLHMSHPNLDNSPSTSAPHKKRLWHCFVCGGTGKDRLNPHFCPRTYELLSKCLVKFDVNFRLVSDDSSPLPMTQHPGGVAAHLLSPRRLPPRTIRVSPRRVTESPGTSQSNPPHVHRAPHASPIPVPLRAPNAVPTSNSNPPHVPPAVVEHPRRISAPDRRFESNSPHFLHVERPSSPLFRILTPLHDLHPPSETPLASLPRHDNSFILEIFDCLILSPLWRRALAALIDSINHLNLDDNIPALRKYVEPLRDHVKTFVPFF
ncbi:hypothetical protein B0H14DRAFT_3592287 [Mycena olivaceomarginata]|nr:hypothetical protein B0H14DRAFT_3592287 [Mycena olivaceomarginata]